MVNRKERKKKGRNTFDQTEKIKIKTIKEQCNFLSKLITFLLYAIICFLYCENSYIKNKGPITSNVSLIQHAWEHILNKIK